MSRLDNIRLSAAARDKLVTLKRYTGIQHWNVLCRWAFCLSLSEPGRPARADIAADSNVEMSWRTFAGAEGEEILWAALKARCRQDGLPTDDASLAYEFRLHLHRGIGYLSTPGKVKSLSDLLSLALTTQQGPRADVQPD